MKPFVLKYTIKSDDKRKINAYKTGKVRVGSLAVLKNNMFYLKKHMK